MFKRAATIASLWLAFSVSNSARAATFSVTTTNDSGAGSFRQALLDANSTTGTNVIHFNIPGGGEHVLQFGFPFDNAPVITNSVVIDGYTQPGARPNTIEFGGNNAKILIVIQTGFAGFPIQSSNVTLRGLSFRSWGDNGAIGLTGGGGHVIEGCFIGTDAAAKLNLSFGGGRHCINLNNCSNNRIGGTNAAAHNVMGFSLNTGIALRSGTNNAILGNTIFGVEGLAIHLNYPQIFRTTNDVLDLDAGANNLQNYPLLASAAPTPQGVQVQGSLQSASNRVYRVEFFSTPALSVDPNYVMPKDFVGWTNVLTDANGLASFSMLLPIPVPAGYTITATATDPDGNTSEFAASVQIPAPQYIVKPLGSLGRDFAQGNHLNNRGEVVGFAYTGTPSNDITHAFFYRNGVMTDLGTLGGLYSVAWAINDQSEIVGWAEKADRAQRAVRWSGGAIQDLGALPGGSYSLAIDINNRSQIVGYSETQLASGLKTVHAFLFDHGTMSDLGTLPGHGWSEAWGVSENGDVIGISRAFNGSFQSQGVMFFYRNGKMTSLDDLSPPYSFPARFNRLGDIAAPVFPGDGTAHGFVRLAGVANDFGIFGGQFGQGNDVNDSGWAVGFSSVPRSYFGTGSRAVLYHDATTYDLNALLLNNPGTILQTATAINDDGVILANNVGQVSFSTRITGQGSNLTNTFLLYPVSRALTLDLAGPNVVLSWFTNLNSYVLQSTASLSAPANWTTVTGPIPIVGDRFNFTNSASTGSKFFRLVKP